MTRAVLPPGEDVLILGVGGGVGSAGLQIAKLTGARVFATASSDENSHVHARGAQTLQLTTKTWISQRWCLQQRMDRGVDVVLEHVGAATWEQSIASLAKNGRLVSCGVTTGNIGQLTSENSIRSSVTVMGSALGTVTELRTLVHLAATRKIGTYYRPDFAATPGK